MRYKIKPCDIVGYAFRVVAIGKYGREKTMARGLTEFEAICYAKQLSKFKCQEH